MSRVPNSSSTSSVASAARATSTSGSSERGPPHEDNGGLVIPYSCLLCFVFGTPASSEQVSTYSLKPRSGLFLIPASACPRSGLFLVSASLKRVIPYSLSSRGSWGPRNASKYPRTLLLCFVRDIGHCPHQFLGIPPRYSHATCHITPNFAMQRHIPAHSAS